jgi:alkane 1-monooxygenase
VSNVKKLLFLSVYCLVPLPLIGFYLGGAFNFITFLVLFTLIPIVDLFITDTSNPSNDESKSLQGEDYFKWIVLAYLPVQFFILGFSLYLVHTIPLSLWEWLGFCISVGFVTGGVGINLAHELMHKNGKVQQTCSKLLLSMVCYGHFFIEHVRGHHVRVATFDDPATSRYGESLYQFLPRTLKGSLLSAWSIESKRLKRRKKSLYHNSNQFYWILGAPITIILVLFAYGGINTVAFFLLQAFVAILTLEVVNYIEHYGLVRKKLENGNYEKVTPLHSWNANHWLSNLVLFHLQRHSDHHAHGAKPYQVLMHVEESPQLPSGYLGMMILALIPPLWKKVMDPKVLAYREKIAHSNAFVTKSTAEVG